MVAWKPTLDGDYEVSDVGSVRRAKPGRGKTFIGRLLKPYPINAGHLTISVWRQGRRVRRLVHVLVAEAFLGPCPNGLEVNHKDGNPANNRVTNLEYITHSENIRHGYRNKRGERHPLAKSSNAQVAEIHRRRAAGERGVDLAREYGISQQQVCGIFKGRVQR